jgi:tungstate transport system ATP-binding protein
MNDANPNGIILKARDLLVRRGGATVLSIPEIEIRENEILALIGPNGAGKSTLMLALATLLKLDGGEIFFAGLPIGDGGISYRRQIAMVFQEPLLFDATVFDNVAAGLKIRGLAQEEIKRRVPEALARFGIEHLATRSARKLSGGEAKRTSLARAFVTRPRIVFLDEAFSSLDPPSRETLITDLTRILRDTQTTAVISTHDRLEALRIAQDLAVLQGGAIAQIGAVADVLDRPASPFVASFVGVENILQGRACQVEDGIVSVVLLGGQKIAGVGKVDPASEVVCCLRPEQVTISPGLPSHSLDVPNIFPGTIRNLTCLGHVHRVRLDCGFELTAYVTVQSLQSLGLVVGGQVTASFQATAVHILPR